MPTVTLPSPAWVSTCESATAPATALLTAPATELLALDNAEPAALCAALATLCPALATLEAALAIELAVVCGVELLQPVTTRASATAPATADPILRSFIRCFLPVIRDAGPSRALVRQWVSE